MSNEKKETAAQELRNNECAAGQEQIQPVSSPLLVIRKQADRMAGASSAAGHEQVVDLDAYRAGQEKASEVEETLVNEWHLTPGNTEPLIKLIMVSSGFGGKRGVRPRSTDIQCLAA
ncbi:hypothetical protein ACFQ88_32420 [Paenibacillus sp. NPDC056579]|uniref:hypothetical protein n=1 Tax=Paenibacillus sp. NPDC056579 TaxID=3345871 RepID=UPI0036A7B9D1